MSRTWMSEIFLPPRFAACKHPFYDAIQSTFAVLHYCSRYGLRREQKMRWKKEKSEDKNVSLKAFRNGIELMDLMNLRLIKVEIY